MIEDVATDVANKLFNSTPSRYLDEFIGMEAHMNKISRVLRTDLDEVRMIGIWGPAGIGKTTIARSGRMNYQSYGDALMEKLRAF
ncbi:hypothetical protein F2Q69_00039229 [Brassica cretica]|uniref:NB-ARC domain-containing protein n=1 Tax=Brassica cretica TaxID=69181 RepID=A0A8S9SIN5_BRACR|nr:hypothetical protein F2Q69_00039229 [Brassica cretica]